MENGRGFGVKKMETRVYHTINKSVWGKGPWSDEPDKMQWQDSETGMPCLIIRGPHGSLCGYVGVTQEHPAYGRDYHDEKVGDIEVHGGLTFSGPCQEGSEAIGICHVPGDGEPDDVWWFGFDCAHSQDLCPSYQYQWLFSGIAHDLRYRDVPYVTKEVGGLAKQLAGQSASGE